MKTMRFFSRCLWVAVAVLALNACDLDDDDDGYSLNDAYMSIATVHPQGDGHSYSLTLDNGMTLWPAATRVSGYKPVENQRALIYYTLLSDAFQGYDHAVQMHDIQDILTKPYVEYQADSLEKYGDDPVEIIDMWIGDGFLNVQFGFNYGGSVLHYINLVHYPESSVAPHYFEFKHNAYNDTQMHGSKGLVAFDLSKLGVNMQEAELTVKVKTFAGDKEYKVKYKNSSSVESSVKTLKAINDFVETK